MSSASVPGDTVTIREYLDKVVNGINSRIDALDEKVTLVRNSQTEAYGISDRETQRRLAAIETRLEQIQNRLSEVPTREEYVNQYEKMCSDIRELRETRAMWQGKADQSSVTRAQNIALAGVAIGLLSLLVTTIVRIVLH
jgi:chromosome segregation ATPase